MPDLNEESEYGELSGFAAIGKFSSLENAHEAGLSILACGHLYGVVPVDGFFYLVVPPEHADSLRTEIRRGERFNRNWPPKPLELPSFKVSPIATLSVLLVLIGVFVFQSKYPELTDYGLNSKSGVLSLGEHWRLLTAITLHADLEHLASNLMGMFLFGYFCCRYLGNGLGWLSILLASVLSNFANIVFQSSADFRSLGASTAVFAALGILSGFPAGASLVRWRGNSKFKIGNVKWGELGSKREWLVPFFGGCVLLAWMGGGGDPHTDHSGHLWSFIFGTGMGVVAAWSGIYAKVSTKLQWFFLACVVGLTCASWLMALANA